jgi:hypothetical protein
VIFFSFFSAKMAQSAIANSLRARSLAVEDKIHFFPYKTFRQQHIHGFFTGKEAAWTTSPPVKNVWS